VKIVIHIAEATQTNKRTAGVFLDTLSALAYKESKKRRICLARLWQTGEAKENGPHGL
jgi:hypothetical protein